MRIMRQKKKRKVTWPKWCAFWAPIVVWLDLFNLVIAVTFLCTRSPDIWSVAALCLFIWAILDLTRLAIIR